jgi:hypothetical protein
LPEIRAETAANYSQQVLESIIDTCDNARLPTFFSVESGASSWTPSYSASGTALIPMLQVGQTSVTGVLGGGEARTSQLQYNDFGSAAMSRIASLYHLLCFKVQHGDLVLPQGTLLTVVDRASSGDHFLYRGKMRNGHYLGVTPAKSAEFLLFARDVTFWSRNATPDVHDLSSTTGKLYRFSVEYPTVVANLVTARLGLLKTTEALTALQTTLQAKQQAFEALQTEAKTSRTPPLVLQTLLQVAIQELTALTQARSTLSAARDKQESDVFINSRQLVVLEALFAEILTTLKEHDPSLADLDIVAILDAIRKTDEVFLHGERQQLEAIVALQHPQVSGAKAQEPVDELYRERFEALPPSFIDPRRQALP